MHRIHIQIQDGVMAHEILISLLRKRDAKVVEDFMKESEEYLKKYVDMTDQEITSFVLGSDYKHNMDPLIVELARRLYDYSNPKGLDQAS